MYLYKTMQIALIFQTCINLFIPTAQILNNHMKGTENKWISFAFIGVGHYMRICFDVLW